MPEPPPEYRLYPKGPNFGLIVLLAAIALLVMFIIFYFFVGRHGRHMLPHTHRRRFEPHSRLVLPSPPAPRINLHQAPRINL